MGKKKDKPATDWHRVFGLLLRDFFTGTPFTVELEVDLSLKAQLLDVVVVRKGQGPITEPLPDGLTDLADHNLITFKSHHEALDDWALKELTGHYVNYRKQLGGRDEPLLPEENFHLYAVCSRYPHNLAGEVTLQPVQPGVYDCRRGSDRIRVIVVGQLAEAERNALLVLFSALEERVEFGARHYHLRSGETSTLVYLVFKGLQEEGLIVPYTIQEFNREFYKRYGKEILEEMTLEQRLQSLSPEQRVEGLSAEQRVEGLSAEQRVEGLSAEQRVEGLSADELERLLRQRRQAEASAARKKGKRPSRSLRKP